MRPTYRCKTDLSKTELVFEQSKMKFHGLWPFPVDKSLGRGKDGPVWPNFQGWVQVSLIFTTPNKYLSHQRMWMYIQVSTWRFLILFVYLKGRLCGNTDVSLGPLAILSVKSAGLTSLWKWREGKISLDSRSFNHRPVDGLLRGPAS